MISWLTWKIGGIAALAGCAVLGLLLLGAKIENRSLTNTVEQRDKQIVVLNRDLAQAQTNVATLQGGVDQQNRAIETVSKLGIERTAAAEQKVGAAKAETARARQKAEDVLRYKPKGDDAGARMLDVDRKFVEGLK